ncbi:hypothetical protein [Luteimicrobium subarcticum]|uniref:Uncharacterized protein n=1 Tax=Luteimicrobium subarcticum TaxID=620910 RepID=A0A2M8WW89_9MICO|nr:hypothetical protein [Luteimicrobium subarcticum]PJI95185.1 hypothetical protein CLV34_1041 [Luteimicrobium subarcticum]
MTTDAVGVLRESMSDWPALRAAGVGEEYGILSATVSGMDHDVAVDVCTQTVGKWVRNVGPGALVLVARLGSVDASSRLARYRIEKSGPWSLPGAERLRGLTGERDFWIPSCGVTGEAPVYGAVRVPREDLPAALVAGRGLDAAVVGLAQAPDLRVVLSVVAVSHAVPLFEGACARLGEDVTLVARGFGSFDDREAGVDVVARADLLDELATDI